MGDRTILRPLPTQDSTTQKKADMRRAVFELTIPVLERSKTISALDSAATGVGRRYT